MAKVWVVGSSNIDLIFYLSSLPVTGETILAKEMSIAQGGKGANQAIAVSRSGAEVNLVGAIGDDEFGVMIKSTLLNEGIAIDSVKAKEGVTSGLAVVNVDTDGSNTIVVAQGANAVLNQGDIEEALQSVKVNDWVMAQLEVAPNIVENAFRIAQAQGAHTVLNYSPLVESAKNLLKLTTLLIVNEVEATCLSRVSVKDPKTAIVAAGVLFEMGPSIVTITLGEQGVVCLDNDQKNCYKIHAVNVKAIDTQGAGDAFAGVMVGMLAQGFELKKALRHANWIAAQTVCHYGSTRKSMPTKDEIRSYLCLN